MPDPIHDAEHALHEAKAARAKLESRIEAGDASVTGAAVLAADAAVTEAAVALDVTRQVQRRLSAARYRADGAGRLADAWGEATTILHTGRAAVTEASAAAVEALRVLRDAVDSYNTQADASRDLLGRTAVMAGVFTDDGTRLTPTGATVDGVGPDDITAARQCLTALPIEYVVSDVAGQVLAGADVASYNSGAGTLSEFADRIERSGSRSLRSAAA